jgi:molybdopterin-guanine dinucleotide biosynthesis protein A
MFASIILCGGRSSRMGRPKAWLPLGEEVFLQRVVRIIGEVTPEIVVVAAPEQELPPLPASVTITRDPQEGLGPLAGLAAGLALLSAPIEAAYLSSCDVPFLKPAFVRRMFELLGESSICVPEVDGYKHQLAAVYRPAVLPEVQQLLAQDRRRPVFLFENVPTRLVTAQELRDVDENWESLRNCNSPEDYEQVLLHFRQCSL